ncbi:MAG: hypothetical protein FWD76_01725, partial [Firmicutes bacterium]|nr:hypothetical protein [Bacillota bacterium]
MKKSMKWITVFLLCVMGVSLFVACKDTVEQYSLSDTQAEYQLAQSGGETLSLPSVKDKKGKQVGNDKLSWSVVSGDSAALFDGGYRLQQEGVTVFGVDVKGKSKKKTFSYTYTVTVVNTFNGGLDSDLSSGAYSTNPGIAKRRVFGSKDIDLTSVSSGEFATNQNVVSHQEIITVYPGVEGVTNEDYEVKLYNKDGTDSTEVSYEFVGDNQIQLDFDKATKGIVNLKITLLKEDEIGEYPFVSYAFDVVDGINVYNYEQLQAVQNLVVYNGATNPNFEGNKTTDTSNREKQNKYTYNKSGQSYTGWDGTKFESIVLRNDIKNIDNVTLFYGSVYGNGYTLDATPYSKMGDYTGSTNTGNKSPMNGQDKNIGRQRTACFYLMSDNTVLDNVDLVGTSDDISNLSQLGDSKIVLSVFGTAESLDYDVYRPGNNVDENRDIARTPENIKIINSIIERGFRLLTISGAANEQAPILVESSIVRQSGDHSVWMGSNWARGNTDGNIEKEFRCFATFKNNVMSESRMPTFGMPNNTVTSTVLPWAGDSAYGAKLTFEGDRNFIFNWTKFSEMDFGEVSGVSIAQVVKDALFQPENKPLLDSIVVEYGNSANAEENMWFNLCVFGNFIQAKDAADNTNKLIQPNAIDVKGSNLEGALNPEEVNALLPIKVNIISTT